MKNEDINYTRTGDVITATPPGAKLRIELYPRRGGGLGSALCVLAWGKDTAVIVTVHQPHDQPLHVEACSILSALYWSRARAANGAPGFWHLRDPGGPEQFHETVRAWRNGQLEGQTDGE